MLNPFPDLLTFSLIAPFILRIAIGLLCLRMAGFHVARNTRERATAKLSERLGTLGTFVPWSLSAIELLAGLSLIAGFLTQIGAILGIVVALGLFSFRKKYPELAPHGANLYFLMVAIGFSLLLSGAGAFAFDLPL